VDERTGGSLIQSLGSPFTGVASKSFDGQSLPLAAFRAKQLNRRLAVVVVKLADVFHVHRNG
jgi:hypothetical protein